MNHNENYKKLKQAMHMVNIASLGLKLQKDIDEKERTFLLLQENVDLDIILEPEAFAPVLLSMADMFYDALGLDSDFKSFQPVKLIKKNQALCSVVLKADEKYKLEETGFSDAIAGLCLIEVMDNLFQPNSKKQILLEHIVKVWRTELSQYKDGEVIDIRKHREALFEGNLNPYPKIRIDLKQDKKNDLKNDLF
jgi:hypothetical protein